MTFMLILSTYVTLSRLAVTKGYIYIVKHETQIGRRTFVRNLLHHSIYITREAKLITTHLWHTKWQFEEKISKLFIRFDDLLT